MRVSLKKLFVFSRSSHRKSVAVSAALPMDIKDPPVRARKRASHIVPPRWMLRPPSEVSVPCLRTIVSGKLSQRVHRALRPIGCKPAALDAMSEARRVDPNVRDLLSPGDRVLLQLYVGGEAGARERQAALTENKKNSPTEANELQVLKRVLAPFDALHALFDLEAAVANSLDQTPEELGRAMVEALCDDPAGVRTPAIALVACDLSVRHGGLFKARERVRVAQMEMLTGNAPNEPAKITGALDVTLQHLAHAGFPDVSR